jgi:drug/metabolite transporter (DMT)-like permease
VSLKLFALIIGSVMLSALAQLVLKSGMSSDHIQRVLAHGKLLETAWTVASNLYVIAGLSLYAFSAVVWLLVLARVDVSFAYPFVGLGFILTMLLGWLVLHEPVGISRLLGTLLVALGVYLISRS